jgi:hypothetical protein
MMRSVKDHPHAAYLLPFAGRSLCHLLRFSDAASRHKECLAVLLKGNPRCFLAGMSCIRALSVWCLLANMQSAHRFGLRLRLLRSERACAEACADGGVPAQAARGMILLYPSPPLRLTLRLTSHHECSPLQAAALVPPNVGRLSFLLAWQHAWAGNKQQAKEHGAAFLEASLLDFPAGRSIPSSLVT